MATFSNVHKTASGVSEIDFLFSDGSDFLFSDGSDYVFREGNALTLWTTLIKNVVTCIGRTKHTSSFSNRQKS